MVRDIVAGALPMVSGVAVTARIVVRAHVQQVNEAITAAIERGADHVDLPMDGGRTWRVHIRQ